MPSLDAIQIKRLVVLGKVLRLASERPIDRGELPWNRDSLYER